MAWPGRVKHRIVYINEKSLAVDCFFVVVVIRRVR